MNNIQPIWLRYGILYGLASILTTLLFFYVIPSSLAYQSLLGIVILVIFLILAGKAQRFENNNILPYGEALKTTFLTGFTGSVISTFFTIILVTLIDPGLVEKIAELSLDIARSMMETLGMPEDQMAKAIEDAEEKAMNSFTPFNLITGLIWAALLNVFVAAIVSIFIKKEETFA